MHIYTTRYISTVELFYSVILSLANFNDNKSTDISKSTTNGSGLSEYHNLQLDPSMSWSDIKWLRTISKLPIVVKGIMTAEDALLCADAQVAAVVVSNHGARQVDGTASTVSITESSMYYWVVVRCHNASFSPLKASITLRNLALSCIKFL